MTNSTDDLVVLRDAEGNYYLLTGETLAGARVSDEDRPALEQALSGNDTDGYSTPPPIPGSKAAPLNLQRSQFQVLGALRGFAGLGHLAAPGMGM